MEIINKIRTFSNKRVLVIGDIILDRYLFGKTDRISPEAPVPVVQLTDNEHRLGGAANVALNIKKLGANVVLCGLVGKDEHGETTKSILENFNISTEGIIKTDRPTTVKSRILSLGQQILRVDSEQDDPINESVSNKILDFVRSCLDNIDLCIIQDYEKGMLNINNIPQIIELCKAKNIYTAVDPKKENFWQYDNVNLFKPNLSELSQSLQINIDPSSKKDIDNAIDLLRSKINHELSVLTLSSHGIAIKDKNESSVIPTLKSSVFDVSGAGDTVISVFALSIISDINSKNAAKLSNIAAHIVCQKLGVTPINIEELEQGVDDYFELL